MERPEYEPWPQLAHWLLAVRVFSDASQLTQPGQPSAPKIPVLGVSCPAFPHSGEAPAYR